MAGRPYYEFSAKISNELDKTKNCAFSPLLAAEITISAKAVRSILPIGKDTSNENNIPVSTTLLSSKLKSIKGVSVNRTRFVYLNIGHYKLDQQQKKKVKQIYKVKIKNIDFTNSSAVAQNINKKVQKKTRGKIKGFSKFNDFDDGTNIILMNALYFEGRWHMKFDPYDTEETIFYLNDEETVNVFLMCRKEKYKYRDCPNLDSQLLMLPFKNQEVQMLIVLPKRVTGLDSVLRNLANGYDLMAEVEQMSSDFEVDVRIPRFKIESEINFVEVLQKLGVTSIFDKAVQTVLVLVNEKGTEPKPERITCGFIPRWKPRPINFIADRPHLIIIIYENIPIIWVTFRGRFE